ncbi:MAG: hypothetical protein V2A74_02350 [bacterium]
MEHTKHIWRAALILAVIFVGLFVSRHFMVPESFGVEGFYRADSLGEYMALSPVHGSATACKECHGDIQEKHDKGKHASVSCETCHGPLAVHVKAGEKVAPTRTVKPLKLCAYCHEKLRARPESFPQLVIRDHLAKIGMDPAEEIPPEVCTTCHDSHDPSMQ